MKKSDDLSRLKHVGASRRKLLIDHGIATVQQLLDIPQEKLAEIRSIGNHYATLLKNSANEYSRAKQETLPDRIGSAWEGHIAEIDRDLQEICNKLNKRIDRLREDLKPLGKDKYLELYIEFKKISRKVTAHLEEIGQGQQHLPKKTKKNIIKKASNFAVFLKKAGKKPKKKKYKSINRKIQAFSKNLQDLVS